MKNEIRGAETPQQERSRRTLDRLLAAAEEVLEEKRFEAATIEEICRRAGYTVGAFYSRFSDKDALLRALEERLRQRMEEELGPLLDPEDAWEGTREDHLRRVLTALSAVYRDRRGSVRALLLRSGSDPELRERLSAFNRRLAEQAERVADPSDPDEATAHRVGQFFAVTALRSAILFPEFAPVDQGLEDEALCAELARAWDGYLRSGPASPTGHESTSPS